ncbi:hypothetical protein KM043_002951 [Ampulex compressa]|nr:hypothetical protein KM043_002951 [Ampulex compressa]
MTTTLWKERHGGSWFNYLCLHRRQPDADLPACATRRRDIVPNSQPTPITLLISTPRQAAVGATTFCQDCRMENVYTRTARSCLEFESASGNLRTVTDLGSRVDALETEE